MRFLITILLLLATYFSYTLTNSILVKEVTTVANSFEFPDSVVSTRQLKTIGFYQAITLNPLFSESRMPLIEVVIKKIVKNKIVKKDLQVQALGIAVSGELFLAIVKDLRSGKVLRLKINEQIDEWRLINVSAGSFVFSNGDLEKVISFRIEGG